ncbi:MAG: DUF1826 domain-containing protein [Pseudomonadota bacterium]
MNRIVDGRSTLSTVEGSDRTHVITNNPADLNAILRPDVNLCLWRRPMTREISDELLALDADHLPDVRSSSSPSTFDEDVCKLLERCDLQPERFRAWRADLHRVAQLYFPLRGGRDVTLRLETLNTDGCRRFHTDRTNLRLLCTYRGPGTEWLTEAQVDRDAECANAGNEAILRNGEPSQLRPFWVGILKGTAFPGNASQGVVHRSPQLEHPGQVRVLFCLDS